MRADRLALASIGIASVAAVGAWIHFKLARPVGSGPAGPAVAREPFAKPWSDAPTVLVGFGDSVTAGYGSTPGHSYFERLFTNPTDEWEDMEGRSLSRVLPKLTARNLARNGSTSLEHFETIRGLPVAPEDQRAVVVMTTGGNDLIHDYGRTPPREGAMYGASWDQAQPWIAAFEARLDEMLRLLERKFPGGCDVFLANIFDPTDAVGDIESAGLPAWPEGLRVLEAYNSVIERVSKRHSHVHLVDVRGVMLGHGIHCGESRGMHYDREDPHYWYYSNLEDPNDRGYDAIRRVFLLEMIAILWAKQGD